LYPVTPVGKIVSLTLVIGSIGVIGYFIGEISNKINAYMEKKKKGLMGTDFSNHYVIIGWNNFAGMVAEQMINANQKVAFVVDCMEDLETIRARFAKDKVFVFFNESTNISDLVKVNITESKAVFVNLKDDSQTLVFVINLKKKFPNTKITTTCAQQELKDTLLNVGVGNVILQNEITSRMVASSLFEPHVAEYVNDLIATSVLDDDNDIQQYKVVETNPYLGKSYMDAYIQLKQDLNIILIGLVVDGNLVKNPPDDYVIKQDDYLVIISYGDSTNFSKAFGVEEGV
jgi:voltage-gated potassium channel